MPKIVDGVYAISVRLASLFTSSLGEAAIGAVTGVIVERLCNRWVPVDRESHFYANALRVMVQLPLGLVLLGGTLVLLGSASRVDSPIEASTLLLFFCKCGQRRPRRVLVCDAAKVIRPEIATLAEEGHLSR